jgi:hypothetical protein
MLMKSKFLVGVVFAVATQAVVVAMDGCCDHRSLESAAKRYALSIANGEDIDSNGIVKDLQFLSPKAIEDKSFARYKQENSFDVIKKQAITERQRQAVQIFGQKFETITDALLKIQFCALLDRIIMNLRPSVSINIRTHPALKALSTNPSLTSQKLLLPFFVGGPIDN